MTIEPIRIGISCCLLGDPVRYDGGHKRNDLIVTNLGRQVDWVPICPEVEAGFGVPREPMQLVQSGSKTRLMTVTTHRDRTRQLVNFSARRVQELKALNLSGFVFKARSPSCGIHNVPLYDREGNATPKGMGLFAKAFQKAFPLIPMTDEDHLADPVARKQFLRQASEYHHHKLMKNNQTLGAQSGHDEKPYDRVVRR